MLYLVFIVAVLVGASLGLLMFFVLGIAKEGSTPRALLTNTKKVFGWFFGSTAFVGFPTMFSGSDFGIHGGQHVLALGYLLGFSLGIIYKVTILEPPYIAELRTRMTGLEVNAFLHIIAFNESPDVAARKLGVSSVEANEAYKNALKKLQRRTKEITDRIEDS